ncbi:MAG: hypothetical protein WAT67_09105 [Candidatus Contendobacter sp.]
MRCPVPDANIAATLQKGNGELPAARRIAQTQIEANLGESGAEWRCSRAD